MADRGRPLPAVTVTRLRRLCLVFRVPLKRAAREEHVSRNTARKYVRPPGPEKPV